MYGIEKVGNDEYCVFLPDNATLRLFTTDGVIDEEVIRVDENTQRELTVNDLSTGVRSFIIARTDLEFSDD